MRDKDKGSFTFKVEPEIFQKVAGIILFFLHTVEQEAKKLLGKYGSSGLPEPVDSRQGKL